MKGKRLMKWWKKLKYWQKGGLIGMLAGLIIYLLSFGSPESPVTNFIWLLGAKEFCGLFKLSGESCAFIYIFFGWLFLIVVYGLIGLGVGFTINKIRL